MIPDTIVAVREKTDVAEARRRAAEFAGFDQKYAGALNIVVTEAASNLVKHGNGGHIVIHRTGLRSGAAVDVIAIDSGPGIPDVARCLADGYSTAGTPGTGLGAISRAASFLDIYSAPKKGAVLAARVGPASESNHQPYEIGAICAPYPGESVSGDCWGIEATGLSWRVALGDGLGHGIFAAQAADAGIEAVMNERQAQPSVALECAHQRLRATRGAAMSVADVNPTAGAVSFSGVGNVAGAIVQDAATRRQMVSTNGTLGHEMRAAVQYQYPMSRGALVIVHSDGLSANWTLEKYPGLFHRHPAVVAGVLFRDHRRQRDDATVVVVRALPPQTAARKEPAQTAARKEMENGF
jgi:anti-sigma regulatory factor (Ser/Thr protein kinase)